MKKRMIKLMTIFCMAGILTVNPVITGLAEGAGAVGADAEEEAEEPETDAEESDEKTDEEVTEEEPETVEAKAEADVQSQSGNDVAVYAYFVGNVTYDFNNEVDQNTIHIGDTHYVVDYHIQLPKPSSAREGYEFVGWYKGDEFLADGTYTVTDTDVQTGTLTFTAGWRQKVTVTVDGTETPLDVENAAAEQVTYALPTPNNSSNHVFADKWIINEEGTSFDSNGSMTVNFAQTNGNHLYDASLVSVNGTDFVKTKENISLSSCWDPTNGYSDFRITNNTSDKNLNITASNNHEANLYKDTFYIDTVPDTDTLTFKANNWTLEKSVTDLKKLATGPVYVRQNDTDNRYYQYYGLTITDSDFEKKVTYIYKDDFTDTTFSNTGTGTATIHPGVTGQTWASILPANVKAERGDFIFAEWNYLLNGTEQISETTEIDFYDDSVHSLTVKPIWKGTYSYDGNAPAGETVTVPKGGSEIVNTEITLPKLNDISGKYTFAGWRGSDNKTYQAGVSYTITEADVTFTAQWKAVSYEVRFVDEDGTEYSKETVPYGNTYSWNRTPSKTGYTFQGWKLDQEVYPENGDMEMPARNLTFTAQWSINSYKISYNGNGATVGVPTDKVEQNYQTDYTIGKVVPTRNGYTFQGWNDGTTTYQPGSTFKVPARDVELTAQWKVNSHQVKYDGNGGKTSAPASKSADYNSNVSVAAGLEKDGYVFEGWEQISTGKILAPGTSFVMPDMDETLKAKWKIAHTSITGKGTYYLVSGQSYTLGSGLKVQGDNSSYSGNMTFYVPQSGYYTFE